MLNYCFITIICMTYNAKSMLSTIMVIKFKYNAYSMLHNEHCDEL